MSTKETYQVAKAMQAKYDEITTLIEAVCKTHLNDEYAAQDPHLRADDLCAAMGVSMSTASAKSSTIMDLFDIYQMDPEWTLKSKMDANLLIWMVMVDGMIVDVRDQPREFQEMVFDMGLIPYIPGEK